MVRKHGDAFPKILNLCTKKLPDIVKGLGTKEVFWGQNMSSLLGLPEKALSVKTGNWKRRKHFLQRITVLVLVNVHKEKKEEFHQKSWLFVNNAISYPKSLEDFTIYFLILQSWKQIEIYSFAQEHVAIKISVLELQKLTFFQKALPQICSL